MWNCSSIFVSGSYIAQIIELREFANDMNLTFDGNMAAVPYFSCFQNGIKQFLQPLFLHDQQEMFFIYILCHGTGINCPRILTLLSPFRITT